jgi:hypothetical protein
MQHQHQTTILSIFFARSAAVRACAEHEAKGFLALSPVSVVASLALALHERSQRAACIVHQASIFPCLMFNNFLCFLQRIFQRSHQPPATRSVRSVLFIMTDRNNNLTPNSPL